MSFGLPLKLLVKNCEKMLKAEPLIKNIGDGTEFFIHQISFQVTHRYSQYLNNMYSVYQQCNLPTNVKQVYVQFGEGFKGYTINYMKSSTDIYT